MRMNDLYESFQKSPNDYRRFDFPFPIAVYGTLRSFPKCQGNSEKMTAYGKVTPESHLKGFLPCVKPKSIWLEFNKDKVGAFEIYTYTPENWSKVIPNVDRLEGFNVEKSYYMGYIRTLMLLRILPNDIHCKAFDYSISSYRTNVDIDKERFDEFETIPAWVYSNSAVNLGMRSLGEDSSILWDYFSEDYHEQNI